MQEHLPHKETILLVEDHPTHMKLMSDLLEAFGYRVLQTPSGWDALTLAYRSQPDLILLDIQLPDISGIHVAPRLKADERTRAIPIIAVTAFAMKGDKEQILKSGCDAYVSKPISIAQFMTILETFLPRTLH